MGFSRQEYWSGLPLPSPKDFLNGPHRKKKESPSTLGLLLQVWQNLPQGSQGTEHLLGPFFLKQSHWGPRDASLRSDSFVGPTSHGSS